MNENEVKLTEELEDISIPEELDAAYVPDEEVMISAEEREIDVESLTELITARKYSDVREILEPLPPIDIAELFYELDARYRAVLFRILPKEWAANVFVEMDSDVTKRLINKLNEAIA